MLFASGALLLLLLIFGPQLWTRHVFRRYSAPIDALPGTGGELALHLLRGLHMHDAGVEETEPGSDHYDPERKMVRLSPGNNNGKSLTAIVIAAHEVGHALQHKLNYPPLYLRWRLARYVTVAEKAASIMLIAAPFVTILTHVPLVGGLILLVGIAILLMPVLFHLVTLPVEFDASFNRALPLLERGNYLPAAAMPAARRILTAAALTYLAASLASILNFYRWVAFLRR